MIEFIRKNSSRYWSVQSKTVEMSWLVDSIILDDTFKIFRERKKMNIEERVKFVCNPFGCSLICYLLSCVHLSTDENSLNLICTKKNVTMEYHVGVGLAEHTR